MPKKKRVKKAKKKSTKKSKKAKVTKKIKTIKKKKTPKKTVTKTITKTISKPMHAPKVSSQSVEVKMQPILTQNFITLQKVMVKLAANIEELNTRVNKLLDLFEITARSMAKEDLGKKRTIPKPMPPMPKLPKMPEIPKLPSIPSKTPAPGQMPKPPQFPPMAEPEKAGEGYQKSGQ